MPTAPKGYFLRDGSRVPSVTTILGRFKECGGLMHWAYECGRSGKDYRQERDTAADAGTMAHAAVESWVHGQSFTFEGPEEITVKAKKAFDAFLEWADQTQLKVMETEVRMISETHRYGGTADGFTIRGRRAVLDWKSSNAIYPEYLVQVRAYGELWTERCPEDPIVGGYHLVRFDKTYGDFHHHYWAELETAWTAFTHLRSLYELDKELKARAK